MVISVPATESFARVTLAPPAIPCFLPIHATLTGPTTAWFGEVVAPAAAFAALMERAILNVTAVRSKPARLAWCACRGTSPPAKSTAASLVFRAQTAFRELAAQMGCAHCRHRTPSATTPAEEAPCQVAAPLGSPAAKGHLAQHLRSIANRIQCDQVESQQMWQICRPPNPSDYSC